MKLRFVGISSSPKKERNTDYLIKAALEAARKVVVDKYKDIEVEIELLSLACKNIKGCIDCGACVRKGTLCVIKDDWYDCIKYLIDPVPDGVIIGSPVYFFSTNAQLRAFMERCTCLFKQAWHKEFPITPPDWTKTAAGAVTVGAHRHGGEENAALNIISWFLSTGFVSVGSFSIEDGPVGYIAGTAWTGCEEGKGKEPPVSGDKFGLHAVELLGTRVGETALRLHLGELSLNKR